MQDGFNDLDERVSSYLAAFNRMDMAEVLAYFSPDVVYEPGDGTVFHGKNELRKAFAPQFAHAYGSMVFEEEDRIIDTVSGKVMLSWVCKMDVSTSRFVSMSIWLRVLLARLRFGDRGTWRGLDLLFFDADGKIFKKLTYANYTSVKLRKGWAGAQEPG